LDKPRIRRRSFTPRNSVPVIIVEPRVCPI
jgi:hypothetical protein